MSDYDLESLNRFIDSIYYNRPSDDPGVLRHQAICRQQRDIPEKVVTPEEIAAAFALRDALIGVNLPKKLGYSLKSPTEAQKRKTIHHPAYAVVMAALNSEFPDDGTPQRQHAVNEIASMFDFSHRSAEVYYDDVKNSAAKTLKSFKKMFSWQDLEFKAMHIEPEPIDEQIKALASTSLTYNQKIEIVQKLTGKDRPEAQQIYKYHAKQ